MALRHLVGVMSISSQARDSAEVEMSRGDLAREERPPKDSSLAVSSFYYVTLGDLGDGCAGHGSAEQGTECQWMIPVILLPEKPEPVALQDKSGPDSGPSSLSQSAYPGAGW